MKKILDIAIEHFANQGSRKILVPEWKDETGKPIEIYVTPMTLAEKKRLYHGSKTDDVSILADCVIMKSEDSKGHKMFSVNDKQDLMYKVDPDVLSDIATKIMTTPSPEDYEKN